jgi:CRP-like cAMP-binding protein
MPEVHSYLELLTAMDEKPMRFKEGQVLFEEGQPADGRMYVVRSGTVVLRSGRRLLETVESGGMVGEMALIDPAPRSASAIAGPDCSVSAVDEALFFDLIQKVPGLAIEVMRILSRRLRLVTSGRRAMPRPPGQPQPAAPHAAHARRGGEKGRSAGRPRRTRRR